jgi:Cu(I)/Ag(I) efflux system membrane fusion protein
MKKLLVIALAMFTLSACDSHEDHANHKEQTQEAATTYICPMHPHIKGEKGDTCPICNMYLEPQVNDSAKSDAHKHHEGHNSKHENHKMSDTKSQGDYICPMCPSVKGHKGDTCPHCNMNLEPAKKENKDVKDSKANASLAAVISDKRLQNANVKTSAVLFGEVKQEYNAFARVVSQNKIVESISMRDNGWIEKVANLDKYDYVKKGDFLFEFYSPEIKSAQIDYIIALKQNNKRQAESSKIRLENLGVQDKAIQELTQNKQVVNTTKFYAPIDGYIKDFNINKGQHVKLGDNALTVQAQGKLFINAYVPKNYIELVKSANAVIDNGKLENKTILPELDEASQNYIVRFELLDSMLKDGDYLDVMFVNQPDNGLVIPKQAILIENGIKYVFVKQDSSLYSKKVTTGAYDNANIIVKTGLEENDMVVTNGQFLVDSEARLQSAFNSMSMHSH